MLDAEALAEMLAPVIAEEVAKATAPLLSRIAELEARKPEPGPAGEKGEGGEKGADGTSPEPEAVAAALLPMAEGTISEAVTRAVSALPPAERGEKGEPGERGEKGEPGVHGSNGRDGAGIIDGFVSREGHLIATLSDGTTKDLGQIVGNDGRDGKDGKKGRDGFGFDDMDVSVLDDDRTIELSFRRGEEEKAFTLKWPTVIYRGVFSEGTEYQPGDMVTWGGSLWHCGAETKEKPGTGSWTLAAKKGRDGKDAKPNV